MTYSRRDFLSHLSLGAGLCALGSGLWPSPLFASPATGQRYIVGTKTDVCLVNLASRKVTYLPVGFKSHFFVRNPHYPRHLVTLEKWGPKAAVVEYQDGKDHGKLVHAFSCPDHHLFFGHAVFSPFDNRYLLTRVDMKTGLGYLIGYDAESFKEVSQHQVVPGGLHECRVASDNTILIAGNGVKFIDKVDFDTCRHIARPSLVRYDLQKDKVISNTLTADDQAIVHFNVLDNGAMLGASTTHSDDDHGNGYYCAAGAAQFTKIDWGADTDKIARGEVLNIAVDPTTNIAMLSLPESQMIVLVDWHTGKLIKRLDRQNVRSITYNPATKTFLCARDNLRYLNDEGRIQGIPIAIPERIVLIGSHSFLLDA